MTYKVLIVDDSKLARMSVAKALDAVQPGWGRVEAANADEALEKAADGDIRLALLDFNMPGRDGLELAAELKRVRPELKLAVLSANLQQEIVAQAKSLGAAFLAKPLTEKALAQYLSQAGFSADSGAK